MNLRMKTTSVYLLLFFALFSFNCSGQLVKLPSVGQINEALNKSKPLTSDEVAGGLKEALTQGIAKGATQASQKDGYFGNQLIRIPFPEDVKRVESTLRNVGLGSQVDKFVLSLNRAAEDAAQTAKPIFLGAIRKLTFKDVWNILTGEKDAATQFLRRTTSEELYRAFAPHIQKSLDKTYATKYYSDVMNAYNAIPLTQKVNPNLNDYATKEAMDGLFLLVAQEEANIRENPVARTTDLLKRVFSKQAKS